MRKSLLGSEKRLNFLDKEKQVYYLPFFIIRYTLYYK
jgi:hypothetical protein